MIPRMIDSRMLVKPFDQEKSQGGIILPDSVKGESALEGIVEVCGPDCKQVHVKDRVHFALYSKTTVPNLEGVYKDYLIVNEEDILMYFREESNDKDQDKRKTRRASN